MQAFTLLTGRDEPLMQPAARIQSRAAFTGFDWLLIVIVLVSVVAAFRRGIIKVLFSLAGLVAGIVLASWNYPRLALWLHRWITSDSCR